MVDRSIRTLPPRCICAGNSQPDHKSPATPDPAMANKATSSRRHELLKIPSAIRQISGFFSSMVCRIEELDHRVRTCGEEAVAIRKAYLGPQVTPICPSREKGLRFEHGELDEKDLLSEKPYGGRWTSGVIRLR